MEPPLYHVGVGNVRVTVCAHSTIGATGTYISPLPLFTATEEDSLLEKWMYVWSFTRMGCVYVLKRAPVEDMGVIERGLKCVYDKY